MKLWVKNTILIAIVVIISVVPLLVLKDAEFAGADGIAENIISEIAPDYEPWFSPLVEPKSGEIESLLFSLKAALGAGTVCFILGRITAKQKKGA